METKRICIEVDVYTWKKVERWATELGIPAPSLAAKILEKAFSKKILPDGFNQP